MGRAKAILPFGGATILQRMLTELRRQFDQLIVVAAPADAEPFAIESIISAVSGAILLRDDYPFNGPVGALLRAMDAATHDVVFAASCDLPLLRAELARFLCHLIDGYDAAIPDVGGRLQPLCAAYRRSSREALTAIAASGETRLTSIVSSLNARIVGEAALGAIDPELRSFLNLNTPEDYARALRIAGF
jgi:molybdopterin-guanine dinucleotide biosynthesis protein A